MDEILDGTSQIDCDILIIGGGTAGPMAALKAKRKNPEANVVLLDKANAVSYTHLTLPTIYSV